MRGSDLMEGKAAWNTPAVNLEFASTISAFSIEHILLVPVGRMC